MPGYCIPKIILDKELAEGKRPLRNQRKVIEITLRNHWKFINEFENQEKDW